MNTADVRIGRVYLVWRNRQLRPVFIDRKNVHGGYDGHIYPKGKPIRVRDASKISQEFRATQSMDFKSRAAGEREE